MATKPNIEAIVAAAVAQALAAQSVAAVKVAEPKAEVASLAIADSAWEALESALVGAYDTNSRDQTFLGAVLNFGKLIPADWKGKPLPDSIVDVHADNVKRKLEASYGDMTGKPKEEQDRVKKSCAQKHARAKALFTCAAILPTAYEQGFKGGVVEAGKLCTELKAAKYNLAAVMKARAEAANAPTDHKAEVAALIDRILNMKAEGDTVPLCLNAVAKAKLVKWADDMGLTLKHGNAHRNNPLAV